MNEYMRMADRMYNLDNQSEELKKKIAELEKENAELKKEIEKHKWNDIFLEDCADYDKKIAEEYKTLQERITELEQQIEKMENCYNCANYYTKACTGCEDYCNWKLEEEQNE